MEALYSNNTLMLTPTINFVLLSNCNSTTFLSHHHILLKKQYPFPQISYPSFIPLKNQNFITYPLIKIKSSSNSSTMASSNPSSTETKPYSVLFVCLGNICRSPAAEGVFSNLVKKRGLDSNFTIDSAGTINYHEGNPADSRMRSAAKRRGIEITSISRPIKPSDFNDFDLILAMDKSNKSDILEAFDRWKEKYNLDPEAYKKVKLMCSYCKKHNQTEVPDPYYGGQQGFETVLDLLEDACESFLETIVTQSPKS